MRERERERERERVGKRGRKEKRLLRGGEIARERVSLFACEREDADESSR